METQAWNYWKGEDGAMKLGNRGECTQGGKEIKDQLVTHFTVEVRRIRMT